MHYSPGVSDLQYSITNDKQVAWTPDLIGPIFKNSTVGLREVLFTHRSDKCVRNLATFVPDELIYETDISRKNFRKFNAVVALIDVSRIFGLYKKFMNAENGGSYTLIEMLNDIIGCIVEEVYYSGGDVFKFSIEGLIVLWRISEDDFFSSMVYNVILYSQRIQTIIGTLKTKIPVPKVDIVVSAGEIIFSVIGYEKARDFVIGGTPVTDLKFAKRICLSGDLVLASSAWEHCAPNQYEYVIKDSSNVKIIRVLGIRMGSISTVKRARSPFHRKAAAQESPSKPESEGDPSLEENDPVDSDLEDKWDRSSNSGRSRISTDTISRIQAARVSMIEALKQRLGKHLETYMVKPVLFQIKTEAPLQHLTEVKRLTVMSVNIIPSRCSVHELISLVDELFTVLLNIVGKYSGCVCSTNIYTRDILFLIVYGLSGTGQSDDTAAARGGVLSAPQILSEAKRVVGVKTIFIGISTGMAFCGVVGHVVRKSYMVLGVPVDKAMALMSVSFGKISCDFDTVLYSSVKRETFRSRGMKMLKGIGRAHIYEILDKVTTSPWSMSEDQLSTINYVYPLLGRTRELELFKDILDEIGVSGKSYSGMLIEGAERSGKSRLLDAFSTVAQNRQLTVLKLTLTESYAEKEFSVLYQLLLQLFGASYCTTIEERERVVVKKLTNVISHNQFCYLNPMMKVQFPLSQNYCKSSDWERHTKTIDIVKTILLKMGENICILLDDSQNMDVLSWKFLAAAMENDNVIIATTLLEPLSWDNLSQVQQAICQDKRLMNRSLTELEPQYITAFACQFLNVLAIPKILDRTLQKRGKNSIAWCEAFLTSTLQIRALEFVNFTPADQRVHELVFPESSLVAKIPANMTPEEVAPPLNWTQMSTVNVCVPSWQHKGAVEISRDVMGLRIDIYNRMNSYEQDFVKCVATLGGIFPRSKIATVMINAAPLYTCKGKPVAEMIQLRILECAMIQRRQFHVDESMFFLYKRRKTFSNMHHVITCHCQPTRVFAPRSLPPYAHCQYLEFTIPAYRKLFYNILRVQERKDFHVKAMTILERDARRCNTCGSGKFLAIFSKGDVPPEPPERQSEDTPSASSITMQRRRTQSRLMDRRESKRNVLMLTNGISDSERKSRESSARRISVLPGFDDDNDEEDEIVAQSLEKQVSEGSKKLDIPWENRLRHLRHLDYRNCRCVDIVDYLYSRILFHIESSMDVEKLTKFMLDYSAGLIATGQPIFATKFLSDTNAKVGLIKAKEQLHVSATNEETSTEITLLLIGDAYIAYGNYGQAKRFYKEAVNLRDDTAMTHKTLCYGLIRERLRYKLRGLPNYLLNRVSGQAAVKRLELAIRLQRLASVMMLEQEIKSSKAMIVQSFDAAFKTFGGFLEKGMIYLTAVAIFRCNHAYVRSLEKPMMQAIEEKPSWNTLVEVTMLADVYREFFACRFVAGELKECIEIGITLLKICDHARYNKLKIAVLPCLIEAMVWTKHLNAAIDLLRDLYYLSDEDVDKSALTWYYALSLELLLDAGMYIESFDTCSSYYTTITIRKHSACVCRDPDSLTRLITCLVIWQLRMAMPITDDFVLDVEDYIKDVRYHKYSQIYNGIKGLECYLLVMTRRINIRKSNDIIDRLQYTNMLMEAIRRVRKKAAFVRPFMHLMQAYMFHVRGRKAASSMHLQRAKKYAVHQGNEMIQAWILQNKRTWKERYNNMAQYWTEYLGTAGEIRWQDIQDFDTNTWSTIMYPLPSPDFVI